MRYLDDRIEELDKCVFHGRNVKHYTEYKPDCKSCKGYRGICEEKGSYKPYRNMARKNG